MFLSLNFCSNFLRKKKIFFVNFILCQKSFHRLKCFLKNCFCRWKHQKTGLKSCQTGPNPATISIPVPQKSPIARLLYNDFSFIFILDCTVICSNTLGQNLSKPSRIWRALKTSSQYIDMQQLSKLPLSQISLNMIRAIAESQILSTVFKTFIF